MADKEQPNPKSHPRAIKFLYSKILSLQIIIMNVPFLSHLLKVEPINIKYMLILFALALPILLLMEVYKLVIRKKHF